MNDIWHSQVPDDQEGGADDWQERPSEHRGGADPMFFFLSNVHQAIVMFTNPLQCSPILWQTGRLLSGPTFSQLPLRNLFKGKMSIFIHIQTFFLMVKIYEKNSKWFYISCNNRLLFAGLQWPLWWVSHGQQSPVVTPSSLEFLSKTCERNKSMLCISILFAGG